MSEVHLQANNLDFAEDVLHFADLGFKQMSIEPVVAPESEPYAIQRRRSSADL